MKIIELLKLHNISVSKFADDFSISRTTLYTYIDNFESGIEIKNNKFQKIFTSLFDDNSDDGQFLDKYNRFKELFNRDVLIGINDLPIEETDKLFDTINILKRDIVDNKYNDELHAFLRYIVRNFRTDNILKFLAQYYLLFSLQIELKEIDSNDKDLKSFLGHFFKLYSIDLKENYNDESYSEFIDNIRSRAKIKENFQKNIALKIKEELGDKEDYTKEEILNFFRNLSSKDE